MARVAAWSVLRSGSSTPLREIDRAVRERELDARDAALVRRLVGTEVRRRGTLRAIVRAFVPKKVKPDLTAHLHLGLVQLLFLDRVPDHAAVNQTVGAVAETVGQSKVPLVNGVLRNVVRIRREGTSGNPRRDIVGRDLYLNRDVFRDPEEHPFLWAEDALSVPSHLMKRWGQRLGDERAQALARLYLDEPLLSLRVVGAQREELATELESQGARPRACAHPKILLCPTEDTSVVTASRAFAEGRVTVQGETALAAAELLHAEAGERILDLCAAPGGKTAVLAESGARVLALDIDQVRIERLRETCARLSCAERVETRVGDGAELAPDELFDGVLIDTPCSNTGVLAARPGARWRFGPQSLRSLCELQARLLQNGARHVKPGGRLVWSTCSLEPEENAQRVRSFLEEHADWVLEEEREALPAEGGPIDGGYAARLRKR